MKMNGIDIAVIGLLDSHVYSGYGVHGFPASQAGALMQAHIPNFHWNINEKVSMELALGISAGGYRSFVIVKQAGVNVLYDTLVNAVVHGIGGGLVIIATDDIGCHGSTVEQDSRALGMLAGVPVFDPSSPSDVLRILPIAFQLSEENSIPVLVRLSSSLLKQELFVTGIPDYEPVRTTHRVNRSLSCNLSKIGRKHHYYSHTLPKIRTEMGIYDVDKVSLANRSVGIIACGPCIEHIPTVITSVLTLQIAWPLDEPFIAQFLERHTSVLILEEPSGFIEHQITELIGKYKLDTMIYGRNNQRLPECGPLHKEAVHSIVSNMLMNQPVDAITPVIPKRKNKFAEEFIPLLKTYEAITNYANYKELNVVVDVGSSTYLCHQPYEITNLCYGLGSSIGISLGLSLTTGNALAVIGDYGFIHSGIQALMEAVHQKLNVKIVIVNDYLSRKTGGIKHCISPTDNEHVQVLSIEKMIEGCGIETYYCVDVNEETEVDIITEVLHTLPDRGVAVLLCNLSQKIEKTEDSYLVDQLVV
jgi:indolepyruvate ferredoxin oxidoreductase alpha subunit